MNTNTSPFPTTNTFSGGGWDVNYSDATNYTRSARIRRITIADDDAPVDDDVYVSHVADVQTALNEDAPEWLEYARNFRGRVGGSESSSWRDENATSVRSRPRRARALRQELMDVARRRLIQIVVTSGANCPTVEAVRSALYLIDAFAFDGAPTAQLASKTPQAVEIEWLVGDRSVTASCYEDGGIFLWATDSDGEDLFEEEFVSWRKVRGETYMRTAELLKAMGAEITTPIAKEPRS